MAAGRDSIRPFTRKSPSPYTLCGGQSERTPYWYKRSHHYGASFANTETNRAGVMLPHREVLLSSPALRCACNSVCVYTELFNGSRSPFLNRLRFATVTTSAADAPPTVERPLFIFVHFIQNSEAD